MIHENVTKDLNCILYGGDYNPEQWPKSIWLEDMAYFKKAHINTLTINVFSWAKLQPSEDVYDFTELDEIINLLTEHGFKIILATSTAALPAWMFHRYPEVGRTDFEGRRHVFGRRHNACPNSSVYQKFAKALVQKLAERYGHHPNIICWHVNNEYSGACYCDRCKEAFQLWLQNKYGTIDRLNQAWNIAFWGHSLYAWDEIVPPNLLSEATSERYTAFPAISLDYRRFMSDSLLENFKMERDLIRQVNPHTPITTNLMGTYEGLDYFKWAKELDVVSWDNYPGYDTPWSRVAMNHDLMRGLKQQPFLLMEQTPSQQNWQPYNSLKRPGQMRAQSYQTLAHGADSILFFQMRRSVGACEKFHGAVIEHAGTDQTRVFREVKALGQELEQLGTKLLGAESRNSVGLIFDWDNYWALEYSSGPHKDLWYVDQIYKTYRYFYEQNIGIDMLAFDADFSSYKILLAPVLYMIKPGMKEALDQFVQAGGILVTGFMSGIVGESDNVYLGGYPGPLRQMSGIWVEEIDALAPGQQNTIQFSDGKKGKCGLLCDLMHLEGSEALAHYTEDFYSGYPAVTRNKWGEGQVYYIGTEPDKESLAYILDDIVAHAGVKSALSEKTALEVVTRYKGKEQYCFVMNFTDTVQPLPHSLAGKVDLLSGRELEEHAELKPYDVLLIGETLV